MRNRIQQLRQSLTTVLLVAVAVAASFAAYAVSANDLHFTRVLSSSMEPTLMEGDIAILQDQPTLAIHAGDVVVLPAPDSGGALYSHRLTDVQLLSGTTTVKTKGDNNPFVDPWELEIRSLTVPVVIGHLPLHTLPVQLLDPRNTWILWAVVLSYLWYSRHRNLVRRKAAPLVVARDLGSVKVRV